MQKIAISAENPRLLSFKKALFFDISNVNRITAGLLFNLTTNCREITKLQNWLTNSELPQAHASRGRKRRVRTRRAARRTAGRTDGAAKIRFMNRTFGHIGRKPGFFINFALGNTFAFVL